MTHPLEYLLPKAEHILAQLKEQYPDNQEAIQAAQELVDDLKAEIEGCDE